MDKISGPQTITYREPTYDLHLTSQNPSQATHLERLALKTPPYQSLDHLVDQVAYDRYKDRWAKFSASKQHKLRYEIAHSLMQRPDQKSSLHIQKPLADAQGLTQRVVERLKTVLKDRHFAKEVDLTPFADLLFSHHQGTTLTQLLISQLYYTFGSDPSVAACKDAVFKEVTIIQQELKTLTESTTVYIRPPLPTDGQSYRNHLGKTVPLSQTIPSSHDQDHPHVQNARLNLNDKKHVIYSTGRMETERKADQVVDQLIDQTFSSGQISTKDLIQLADGSYLYPFVVEDLLNSAPTATKERGYLVQQTKNLQSLDGKVKHKRLENGTTIRLTLKPIHFSTHSNYNMLFGQLNGWSSTGSKLSEEVSKEGLSSLKKIYEDRKPSLSDSLKTVVEFCLNNLENCSEPHDRFILRAFICEMLNIPYHIHCRSSKDRTAALAAIKKALHQWLRLEIWKTQGQIVIPDPRQLLNSAVFREYSEAALFENLPLTDQGTGFSGELDGKLHTQNRGFEYRFSLIENPLPTRVFTDRHLYHASLAERIIYTCTMALVGLIGAVLYIALSPVLLIILSIKFKKATWEVAKYIFLCLTLFPLRSGLRQKWLDHNSSALTERSFFRTQSKKELAPSLQSLFDQINQLSSRERKDLIQFIKTGDGQYFKSPEKYKNILRDIAHQWLVLQRQLKSKESLPFCLKAILKAAPFSPVILFQYLNNFSQETISDLIKKTHINWAAENYAVEFIRNPPVDGLTSIFAKDCPRSHYIVQGKQQRHEFPLDYVGNKVQDLTLALQDLSVFKDSLQIPYPIQDTLTQKTTISEIVTAVGTPSIRTLIPPNCSDRTLIIEEGDDSFFWLTIKEKAQIKTLSDGENVISFEYSYTLKISKTAENKWTTSFVALSPVQTKIENTLDHLLESSSEESLAQAFDYTFGSSLRLLSFEFQAATLLKNDSPTSLKKAVRKQTRRQLSILSTTFGSHFFQEKNVYIYLKYFEQSLQESQTEESLNFIMKTLLFYLAKLKEKDLFKILTDTSNSSVKALSERKEMYSNLLKTVLSPENYQKACIQLILQPA